MEEHVDLKNLNIVFKKLKTIINYKIKFFEKSKIDFVHKSQAMLWGVGCPGKYILNIYLQT